MKRKVNVSKVLQLIAIKTNNNFFVSDNINGESYFHTNIDTLLFDGEKPKTTYKKDWFKLKHEPTKIERELPEKQINRRYELKEGFQETKLTPKTINESYIDEYSEYYEVKGLYDLKYDTVPTGFEEIPFEINIVEEINGNFEIVKEEFNVKYNLIDRIQTHPVLLPTKPCYLTKEESYKIIRNHVKANINPKYARVTSDYDFCFTVEKVIELYKPQEYEIDINRSYPRRKPKYEKRYKTARSVKIYEVAPKEYQKYPVVKPFYGENYEDLKKNINQFLDELMEFINEPVVDCEHCKGRGVILNENRIR